MAKDIKYHTLLGKRYKIVFEYPSRMGDADGSCNAPVDKGKTIKISTGLDPKRELEVTVHEILHSILWPYEEDFIEQAGHDIANLLYRLGYRKQE